MVNLLKKWNAVFVQLFCIRNREEMYETMEMDFSLDEAHEELCRDIIQEELFEDVDMDCSPEEDFEYEYQLLRKRYGYWGWRYLDHLYWSNVEAWYTLLEREDCDEFMRTLNEQCKFRMKFIMEELFDGKKVNSHTIKTGLQRELYRWIVNSSKQLIFENCLELLKYAAWEEKTDVILFPEKHKEKNNS